MGIFFLWPITGDRSDVVNARLRLRATEWLTPGLPGCRGTGRWTKRARGNGRQRVAADGETRGWAAGGSYGYLVVLTSSCDGTFLWSAAPEATSGRVAGARRLCGRSASD